MVAAMESGLSVVEMGTGRVVNLQGGRAAQGREGSRFVIRQLCKLAPSGSREWPSALRFYRQPANRSPSEQSRWVKVLRWVICGSRLLSFDRIAILQSGSPPNFRQGMSLDVN